MHNTISPARPPDIFSGNSSVITGRFQGSPTGCVVVSGTGIDGRPWASRVNGVAVGGRALTQLWARAFLADLQRKYLRCPIEEAAWVEQLIVSTSLRFGVLCRFTALVAVSNAPARALSAPREVIQSVELPADWVEPEPGLSPYATEYSRILASSRGSAGGRSTPRLDARTGSGPITPAPPRPSAAPPMPSSPPTMPSSLPPMPSSPPQMSPKCSAELGVGAWPATHDDARPVAAGLLVGTTRRPGRSPAQSRALPTRAVCRGGCGGGRSCARRHAFRVDLPAEFAPDSLGSAQHDSIAIQPCDDGRRPSHRGKAERHAFIAGIRQRGQCTGFRYFRRRHGSIDRRRPRWHPPPNRPMGHEARRFCSTRRDKP